MRRATLFTTAIILAVIAVLFAASKADNRSGIDAAASETMIFAPQGKIRAVLADTEEERTLGLGGRETLEENSGMLFVFDRPGAYGFWMKDMNFPIDIVWIDEDKVVAGVTAGISPETYPELFFPPGPVLYALELNAGVAQSLGLTKGVTADF